MAFISEVFDFIDQAILDSVKENVVIISDSIAPVMGAFFALYVVYLAFKSLYDAADLMIMESIKLVASLAVVTLFAFNTNYYMNSVVPIVLESGAELGALLSGASDPAKSLETLIAVITNAMMDNYEQSSFASGTIWLALVLVALTFIAIIPFTVVSFVYLMFAKITAGLLLIVGPIFICFGFFPTTRSMFMNWLSFCFSCILINILYPVGFLMMYAAVELLFITDIKDPNYQYDLIMGISLAITLTAFCILTIYIPQIAQALTGGGFSGGVLSNLGQFSRALSPIGRRRGNTSNSSNMGINIRGNTIKAG